MKTMVRAATAVVACFLFVVCFASAMSPAPECKSDYEPEKYEIAEEMTGTPNTDEREPRYEVCACGGRLETRKISETGYIKGSPAICSHGLAGFKYTNTITYVTECVRCHTGTSFTREVTEIRCAH